MRNSMKKFPIIFLGMLSVFLLVCHLQDLGGEETKHCSMVKDRNLGDGNWGTHMVPLITAVVHTTGPILEMGCGDYSTPLLHAICSANKRFLLTTEGDKAWMELFLDLETSWHHFQYIPVYETCQDHRDLMFGGNAAAWDQVGSERHWGVVFIDHAPGIRRALDIQRLRNNTDIFVAHDTEGRYYKYESVFATFKYRFTYERYKIQTTLVSDIIDVAQLFDGDIDGR